MGDVLSCVDIRFVVSRLAPCYHPCMLSWNKLCRSHRCLRSPITDTWSSTLMLTRKEARTLYHYGWIIVYPDVLYEVLVHPSRAARRLQSTSVLILHLAKKSIYEPRAVLQGGPRDEDVESCLSGTPHCWWRGTSDTGHFSSRRPSHRKERARCGQETNAQHATRPGELGDRIYLRGGVGHRTGSIQCKCVWLYWKSAGTYPQIHFRLWLQQAAASQLQQMELQMRVPSSLCLLRGRICGDKPLNSRYDGFRQRSGG
jgi:hypothetical protein